MPTLARRIGLILSVRPRDRQTIVLLRWRSGARAGVLPHSASVVIQSKLGVKNGMLDQTTDRLLLGKRGLSKCRATAEVTKATPPRRAWTRLAIWEVRNPGRDAVRLLGGPSQRMEKNCTH